MSRKSRSSLLLTQRALRDIQGILDYSTEQGGKPTAEKYVDEIEAGLERLMDHPDLLKQDLDLHPALQFYRVNKHLLVCDVHSKSIVVLTVIHASMDIPIRLAELQPTLAAEVELLRRRLQRGKPKKS